MSYDKMLHEIREVIENDLFQEPTAQTKSSPGPVRESILNEANLAICGDRAQAYGPPLDNWTRISTLWNAYIMIREQSEKPGIAPFEVAIFNILTKISRLSHTPNHKDSWVDIAGYAACGAEVSGAVE